MYNIVSSVAFERSVSCCHTAILWRF